MHAARELGVATLWKTITWLLFRHLVNKDTAGYWDEIKTTSWPKVTSTNVHTWEWLTSVAAATNYLRFEARICLGRPLGQCVFRLTSAHERGENRSERQVETVLCAGAAAHGTERGLNFIVWNFARNRLASYLYAASATTFLIKIYVFCIKIRWFYDKMAWIMWQCGGKFVWCQQVSQWGLLCTCFWDVFLTVRIASPTQLSTRFHQR